MNSDLLRQRRNLIAISAILLIFDFAQVTITKVSVLGTELLIGNAQVLMFCVWTLWAYFILRYYQYWRAESDHHLRDSFNGQLDKYARDYTKAMPVQDSYGQPFDSYKISRVGFTRWIYALQRYDPVQDKIIDSETENLPAWRLAAWSVKSAVFVCVQTTHATDHVLPFALAIAAPAVTIYSK